MDRKHFYEGMNPMPNDFDVLQQNAENAINALHLSLAGHGVLTGLKISTFALRGGTQKILVENGAAITREGHLLVVDGNTATAD